MHCSAESDFQSKCIKYLKGKGIYHINLHGSAWCGKGNPDLIVCLNGRFVAFELKVGENEMQSDQRIRKLQICRSGGLHYCPYTLESFKEIIEELIRRFTNA